MFIGDILLLVFVFAVYGSIIIIEDLRYDDRLEDGFLNMMVYFPSTNQISYYAHSEGMDILREPYTNENDEILQTIDYGTPGTESFYRKFLRLNTYIDPKLFPITRVCHIIRSVDTFLEYPSTHQLYCDFTRYFNGFHRCLDSTMINNYDVCKIIGEIHYMNIDPIIRIIIQHPNGMYFAVDSKKLHVFPKLFQPIAKLCFKYHGWLTGSLDDIGESIHG